jgi:peptidylprolyl isomerase
MAARTHARVAAAALAAALLLAACGSDDEDAAPTSTTAEAPAGEAPAPGTCADAQPLEPGVIDGKPESVELPDEAPTDEVGVTVLREGDGPEVTDASYVTVHYSGIGCFSGQEFDSSWNRGDPITAALGTAAPTATAFSVIPGWTEGLVGQQQGDLVQIDIPSDLAYGPQGSPPLIAPDEPLTFLVELVEVTEVPPA